MTCKMALIDETDTVCSFADGELSCCQKFLRFSHPGLDDIPVRRLASRFFEQPGEVIGTQANRLSNPENSEVCVQLILNIFDSTHQLFARQPTILSFRPEHCRAIFA